MKITDLDENFVVFKKQDSDGPPRGGVVGTVFESTREAQFVNEFLVRGHLRPKMPIPSAVPKGA